MTQNEYEEGTHKHPIPPLILEIQKMVAAVAAVAVTNLRWVLRMLLSEI